LLFLCLWQVLGQAD